MIYRAIVLGFILFLAPLRLELFAADSIPKDPITEYAFKKIIAVKNDFRDGHLFRLAELYGKLGRIDDLIKVFNLMSDEYHKYSIVFQLLNNSKLRTKEELQKIISLEKEITDDIYKASILFEHLLHRLEKMDKKGSLNLLDKLEKVEDELKYDNYLLICRLINLLYKNGFIKEAGAVLKGYEDYASTNGLDSFPALLEIIRNNYVFFKKEDLDKFISKIDRLIMNCKYVQCSVKNSLEFCLALLHIHHYEIAKIYFGKAFSYCKSASTQESQISCLRILLEKTDNIFIFNFLNQVKGVEKFLIENIDVSKANTNPNYNTSVIKYLIKKGAFKKAGEISQQLDNQNNEPENSGFYMDYFYFYMAKVFLKAKEMRANALDFEKKIKNHPELRLEILLAYAGDLESIEGGKSFLKIIDHACQIEIMDKWKKDKYLRDLSILCLDRGYKKEALAIVEKMGNESNKSILIYEAAQSLVKICDLALARELLTDYQVENHIKAYIMSKIAAKLLIDSKIKDADDMFKKSIDILLSSDIGNLGIIFNDYYYAKARGAVVKTDVWNRINLVE